MKRKRRNRLIALVAVLVLAGIAVVPPQRGPFVSDAVDPRAALPAERPLHEVFLIGDTGAPEAEPLEPALRLLQGLRTRAHAPSTTVFLGDNVYPRGILPPGQPGSEESVRLLKIQLEAMQGLPGRTVFVPGNHDWNHDHPGGAQNIALQKAMVTDALGADAFPLDAQNPRPAALRLDSSLVLVAIDTGWYLHEPRQEDADFEAASAAYLGALADTLDAYAGRRILVAGHHPLFSNGQHSGRYPLRSHIFPLIELRSWAFVPLPVLGTLAFAYVKRYGLTPQDLGHRHYRALRAGLMRVLEGREDIIYAAGHDHNLQYFGFSNGGARQHAIVSGSGSAVKDEELVPGHGLDFGYAHSGIAHVRHYASGAVYLDFVIPKNGGNDVEVVFRTQLD